MYNPMHSSNLSAAFNTVINAERADHPIDTFNAEVNIVDTLSAELTVVNAECFALRRQVAELEAAFAANTERFLALRRTSWASTGRVSWATAAPKPPPSTGRPTAGRCTTPSAARAAGRWRFDQRADRIRLAVR